MAVSRITRVGTPSLPATASFRTAGPAEPPPAEIGRSAAAGILWTDGAGIRAGDGGVSRVKNDGAGVVRLALPGEAERTDGDDTPGTARLGIGAATGLSPVGAGLGRGVAIDGGGAIRCTGAGIAARFIGTSRAGVAEGRGTLGALGARRIGADGADRSMRVGADGTMMRGADRCSEPNTRAGEETTGALSA